MRIHTQTGLTLDPDVFLTLLKHAFAVAGVETITNTSIQTSHRGPDVLIKQDSTGKLLVRTFNRRQNQ